MSPAVPDPDPALLAIRHGFRLLHEADAELFTHQARGLASALQELARKSVDSRREAEARRLADRLLLLYPLASETGTVDPRGPKGK
jgi:hypothetical protein